MTKLEHPPAAPPPTEAWAREDLDRLAAAGLRRHLEPLESPQGPVVTVAGRALLNFSSNDYLSLAADPRVVAAAKAALDAHGAGAGASRLIVGDSTAHRALERAAAAWLGTDDALVFNSGYAANVGALSALLGPDDAVFSDALNHASLIDGCRLARAAVHVYPHRDLAALEALLAASGARRRLVVTDSVFSMDGDRAPLRELRALCDRHGAALYVDEAHALGVLGPQGRGLCAELEVVADLRLGTLGKALGGFGAFLACSGAVREVLFQRARSLVFSTSLPPHVCAAATRAIALVQEDPSPQARLHQNVDAFARGLESLGLPSHRDSAIFSVVLGAPEAAVERSARLRARGVLAKAIRPPTVPRGTSRLRFALCAGHTRAHLEAALEALEATGA